MKKGRNEKKGRKTTKGKEGKEGKKEGRKNRKEERAKNTETMFLSLGLLGQTTTKNKNIKKQ